MMSTTNELLVLASGSPRRVALLAELGVPFQTVVSDAPETIDPRLDPESQAVEIAERKARAVASQLLAGIVLGADTIVVLDGALLGKPVDNAGATSMLRRLSGRERRVVTGRGRRRHDRFFTHIRDLERRRLSRADRKRDCSIRCLRRTQRKGRRLCHPGPWRRPDLQS